MSSRYPQRDRGAAQGSASNDCPPTNPSKVTRDNTKKSAASFTPARIFNGSSPLTCVDLEGFFATCMSENTWHTYSAIEKASIIASLPAARRPRINESGSVLHTNSPLSPEFCLTDKQFRDGLSRFKRDLTDGYYEKAWQRKADNAQQDRRNGQFEGFLKEQRQDAFTEDDASSIVGKDSLSDSDTSEYQDGRSSKSARAV